MIFFLSLCSAPLPGAQVTPAASLQVRPAAIATPVTAAAAAAGLAAFAPKGITSATKLQAPEALTPQPAATGAAAAFSRAASGAPAPPPAAHTVTAMHRTVTPGDATTGAAQILAQPPQLPTHPHPHAAPPPPASALPPNQPEFNHAINYVNKIKNRFEGQPDVYKQFLAILFTYQRDQKAIIDGHPPSGKFLTEAEVHAQVSKLFQNQRDLLQEFGQFLPEATGDHSGGGAGGLFGTPAGTPGSALGAPPGSAHGKVLANEMKKQAAAAAAAAAAQLPQQKFMHQKFPVGPGHTPSNNISGSGSLKRPATLGAGGQTGPTSGAPTAAKKPKLPGTMRDVSLAEAGKYGTLKEYAFFDRVRVALRVPEVYENFLRCLVLFNQEVISRNELVQLAGSFLNRHPELFK